MEHFGLWHASFTVSDLDRAIAFYRDILGWELVHRQVQHDPYTARLVGYPDADIEVAQFAIPGQPRGISTHDLELVHYRTPAGVARAIEIRDPGEAHVAIAVEDADAEYSRLVGLGVEFLSPPNEITAGVNTGGKACYFKGFDGVHLELLQPPTHRIDAWRAIR
ncbi:MAG TPA: VOC family protein [Candidatus Limnocylindrales bacterium]|nr:VOC family protein [Candidatus Limnocylindrales bacterium]